MCKIQVYTDQSFAILSFNWKHNCLTETTCFNNSQKAVLIDHIKVDKIVDFKKKKPTLEIPSGLFSVNTTTETIIKYIKGHLMWPINNKTGEDKMNYFQSCSIFIIIKPSSRWQMQYYCLKCDVYNLWFCSNNSRCVYSLRNHLDDRTTNAIGREREVSTNLKFELR